MQKYIKETTYYLGDEIVFDVSRPHDCQWQSLCVVKFCGTLRYVGKCVLNSNGSLHFKSGTVKSKCSDENW